jgi:hypothetical protein
MAISVFPFVLPKLEKLTTRAMRADEYNPSAE